MAHSRAARTALQELAKATGDRTQLDALQRARTALADDEARAPQHLRGQLHTEVALVDRVIDDLRADASPSVPLERFDAARVEFVLSCEMAE